MFIVAKRLTPLSRCLDMQPASIALGSTLVSQSEYPLYKMHNRVHKLNATVPICFAFDFIWLAVCLAALVSAALALHFAFQNDKSQAPGSCRHRYSVTCRRVNSIGPRRRL